MTPKQKADDLVAKFSNAIYEDMYAKDCALIAVEEILAYNKVLLEVFPPEDNFRPEYWQQVKEEIEKL